MRKNNQKKKKKVSKTVRKVERKKVCRLLFISYEKEKTLEKRMF